MPGASMMPTRRRENGDGVNIKIWRVTIWYEETRTRSQTLHSAETREEAIRKALLFVPQCVDGRKIQVKRAVVDDIYNGNSIDLAI
jgi:hypothetical protein